MSKHVKKLLRRLPLMLLVTITAWWGMSLRFSQELAAPNRQLAKTHWWLPTPHPTPTPWPTPTPFPTPTPSPTSVPSTATPAPTPDAHLRALVAENGFDPDGRFIVVDQNHQRMIVAEDGVIVADMPISTGDPDRGYYTPAWVGRVGEYWGTFSAFGVSADNAWFLFKAAGSILIHGAPYVIEDGAKHYLELYALGVFPSSRGCIRLRPEDAEWFTRWNPRGVPIIILPWTRPPAQG
ncbi:MAG: L,D-transpeptidase [Anaerolineae bacterium]|nr:L,D-transpeptidase [Anaerolineae bacterium]